MKEKKALVEAQPTKETQSSGMTIYEYEQKYTKRQNTRGAKFLLRFVAALVGVFLLAVLTVVSLEVYKVNEYAGYGAAAVSVLLFIFLFIVPVCKVLKSDYFVVNVNAGTAREAKKHNKKLRHDIASKIIDFTASVEGAGWYDSQTVGSLAIALKVGDEEGLKAALTQLYSGSVKKNAKDMIFKSALKSAAFSALSQTAKVDAALVVFVNLQLIKDLVFLYGFRPSDAKLVRILGTVLQNSLIAYGMDGLKIGNTVIKTMGDAIKGIPFLGNAISAIVDSSVQGLTNGTLTAVMGYQTIKYLNREYRLQDILDGVELASDAELADTCSEIEKELKKQKKNGRGKGEEPAAQPA